MSLARKRNPSRLLQCIVTYGPYLSSFFSFCEHSAAVSDHHDYTAWCRGASLNI